jgi:heterodisulfide reductase subunit A
LEKSDKQVLVIGGGVAGLSAALELARGDIGVQLVEKTETLGGHASGFSCKATDRCVQCGACMVQERLRQVQAHKNVRVYTQARVQAVSKSARFDVTLNINGEVNRLETDAIIVATGFLPFSPENKPYGYKRFADVITNLDLEAMLQGQNQALRPSDGKRPETVAFIQCVGSRDAQLKHLWCSRVCCASALRMARLIKARQPKTEITFFYIDVQSFGKDFQRYYQETGRELDLVRAIPADILPGDQNRLNVSWYDAAQGQSRQAPFDLVVLSIGMTPAATHKDLAKVIGFSLAETGFLAPLGTDGFPAGVFAAGSATGPMTIAESITHAGQAARMAVNFLQKSV